MKQDFYEHLRREIHGLHEAGLGDDAIRMLVVRDTALGVDHAVLVAYVDDTPPDEMRAIRSPVRLEAWMAAMRAIPRTSPFLAEPERISSRVAGSM